MRDGIHLNNHGTSNLVACVNKALPIIKLKTASTIGSTHIYCDICKLGSHNTRDCRRGPTGYGRNMYAADGHAQDSTWSMSSRYTGSMYPYNMRPANSDRYDTRRNRLW